MHNGSEAWRFNFALIFLFSGEIKADELKPELGKRKYISAKNGYFLTWTGFLFENDLILKSLLPSLCIMRIIEGMFSFYFTKCSIGLPNRLFSLATKRWR